MSEIKIPTAEKKKCACGAHYKHLGRHWPNVRTGIKQATVFHKSRAMGFTVPIHSVDNGLTVVEIETPEGWKCPRNGCGADYKHTHGTFSSLEGNTPWS